MATSVLKDAAFDPDGACPAFAGLDNTMEKAKGGPVGPTAVVRPCPSPTAPSPHVNRKTMGGLLYVGTKVLTYTSFALAVLLTLKGT